MRARLTLLALTLAAVGALLLGCGTKFKLPTEHIQGRTVPGNGDYKIISDWTGLTGVQDLLLTPGTGAQLFVLFNVGGAGTSPRGGVLEFRLATKALVEGRTPPQGLFNPAALAYGGDGSGGTQNRIYVLDQGDTLIAKHTYVTCDTCHPVVARRYIADLSKYWRVREYGLLGGDTVSTFTDTTLAWVNGVAADANGTVYISGIADVVTPTNLPGVFTRVFKSTIYRYMRVPGIRPFQWRRDALYSHSEGTGVGYINDARGMAWSPAYPTGIYVADYGNNSGQKLSDSDSTGYFRYSEAGAAGPVVLPRVITADISGFAYVGDNGNQRVLRFDPSGQYVQRVDLPDADHVPLQNPTGVAANDSIVYIADHDLAEIRRYQRIK